MGTKTAEPDVDQKFLQDNDSLYVLPLKFVPFETTALRRCRMVKTYPLNTAVEVYAHGIHGRGYFQLEDLLRGGANSIFGWDQRINHPDLRLLRVLGQIDSYDVFSLRLKFRQYEVDYEGNEYLKLSDEMQEELTVYMREFTLPLIRTVFGDQERRPDSVGDIIELLRSPDSEDAIRNLRRLAARLEIGIEEIPRFLADFSDVYMAVSYYKHYTDQISVMNASLSYELQQIPAGLSWKNSPDIARTCLRADSLFKVLFSEVYRRLDTYERETKNFWADLNAEKFREIQRLVLDSQAVIGGVLCGLGVKMSRWRERFPTEEHSAAATRFGAVENELMPGLSTLVKLANG